MIAVRPAATPLAAHVRITRSAEETASLGRTIGRRLARPLILFLYGELGSGKTALAQGVARGLGVPEDCPVTSPTYTLINEYTGRLPFFHVDLYRLPSPVDVEEIGLAEIFERQVVTAVEWPERLHSADHPASRLDIHLEVTGDSTRTVRLFEYGLDPADLLKDIGV